MIGCGCVLCVYVTDIQQVYIVCAVHRSNETECAIVS